MRFRSDIAVLAGFAWLLACLVAAPPARAQDDEEDPPADEAEEDADRAEVVADVKLSGNRRIEAAAVLPLLATKPGVPLDPAALRKDIRTLWEQKFFSDVQVDVTDGPRGPVVTFVVQEKPVVREIRLAGNEEIDEEDLRKELELKPVGSPGTELEFAL